MLVGVSVGVCVEVGVGDSETGGVSKGVLVGVGLINCVSVGV